MEDTDRKSRRLAPHLRVIENDFAKPAPPAGRTPQELEKPPSTWPERPLRSFTGGDWE